MSIFFWRFGLQIATVLVFFAAGYAIEQIATPVGETSRRGVLLNCACGICFHAADVLSSMLAVSMLATAPHLISLQLHDGNRTLVGLGLAFGWVVWRDFFYYWFHRFQHSNRWLWAEHTVHHSDEEMNITTAVRHHWLEMPLNAFFVTAPYALIIKQPVVTVPMGYALMTFVSYYIHCNVRLNLGRFAWLLASPQNHRIHHSRLPSHTDKNFAQFFPLWDVFFGTYYEPGRDEYPATGLQDGQRIRSIRDAMVYPFRSWLTMAKSAR